VAAAVTAAEVSDQRIEKKKSGIVHCNSGVKIHNNVSTTYMNKSHPEEGRTSVAWSCIGLKEFSIGTSDGSIPRRLP
jgi:hypothetical protein